MKLINNGFLRRNLKEKAVPWFLFSQIVANRLFLNNFNSIFKDLKALRPTKSNTMNHTRFLSFLVFILLLAARSEQESYDLIIRNGNIYDGLGKPAIHQDIAIKGDKIVKIGTQLTGVGTKEIEAEGLAVSPGFIDVHTHAEPLPLMPQAESHLRQGVTTSLGGPDSGCPLPIGAYLDS